MTLKIEQIFGEGKTRIRLSGQLRSEHLGQLKTEIARHRSRVALDLEEVELVDLDGVRFLNECEIGGHFDSALFAIHQGMDAAGEKPTERQSGTWMIH